MATAEKKQAEQPLSVESRLKSLYELQTILSQIDRIKTVRGELPLEVRDLEDHIEGLNTRLGNFRQEIEELRKKTVAEKEKINESQAKIATYKTQLDNVRNNREFDLLSKEIEFQTLEIELCEKHINEYARIIDAKTADIAATEETLSDQQHILGEKRAELEEIVSETKQDEERLREQAKALEPKIDARTLAAFKRIRKNARNGLGIVYIQRNACGGCFNRIPPQKQMEIKMHKKIIVCEYCGRIMIDPELAGVEEAPQAKSHRVLRLNASPKGKSPSGSQSIPYPDFNLLKSRHTKCKPTMVLHFHAAVAQLVEHQLPKLRVAGSSPVCRSHPNR